MMQHALHAALVATISDTCVGESDELHASSVQPGNMGCGGSKAGDAVDPASVDVKVVKGKEPKKTKEELAAAAQLDAATKVQAIARGKAAREKVELMKHACDNYRINMQAETFGECMCGWPKADHSKEALSKQAAPKEKALRNSEDLRNRMVKRELAKCEKYVVNLQSANFGECVLPRSTL